MSDIISQLNWRYATKKFDTTAKLSKKQLAVLQESLQLSPSSFGLQPWGFLVVSDPDIRKKLSVAAWGQPQITDASQLVVLCRSSVMNQSSIDAYIAAVAEQRGVSIESLSGNSEMMSGFVAGKSKEELAVWMSRQVYIALGVLLTTCAVGKRAADDAYAKEAKVRFPKEKVIATV